MPELSQWQGEKEYVIANVVVVDPGKRSTMKGHVGVSAGKIAFAEPGEPAGAGSSPGPGTPVIPVRV